MFRTNSVISITIFIGISVLKKITSNPTKFETTRQAVPGHNGLPRSLAAHPLVEDRSDDDDFIAFTNEDSIETFFIRNETALPFPPIKHPDFLSSLSGLTFDWKRRTFFYSEYDIGTINSASFSKNNVTDFRILESNRKAVYACYFDAVENYLYLTSYYDSVILRFNPYDGNSTREIILKLSSNDKVRGIAVDPCDSRIYFANGNFHRPSIQRSSTDGSNLDTIIDTEIKYPRGLTLDHSTKELYWGDRDLNKIERADFDGRNRIVIVQRESDTDFFGIAVTHHHIYWTDFKLKTVFKADRNNNGTNNAIAVKREVRPRGIVYVSKQIDSQSNCITRPNLQNLNKESGDRQRIFGLAQRNQSLQCVYKAGPTTRVMWLHNGNDLNEQSAFTQSMNSKVENQSVLVSAIFFKDVNISDRGNYTCVVSNGFVEESLTFRVDICSACVPRLDKSESTKTLVRGTTSQVLSCKYRSTSEASITWTHNGNILVETFPNFNGTSGESVFKLGNVDVDSAGQYSCTAVNEFGTDYFQFGVDVQEELIKDEIIYALSGAAVLIRLLLVLSVFLWRKYKSKTDIMDRLSAGEVKEFFEGNPALVNSNLNSARYANETATALPFDQKYDIKLEDLVIDKNSILGQGQFGMVLRGEINGEPVAIKTLKSNAEVAYLKALLSEVKIMAYIENHDSIVRFIGAHTSQIQDNIVHMVVELSPIGDLHSYLEKNRSDFMKCTKVLAGLQLATLPGQIQMYENVKPVMGQNNFINWSMQIADGMKYLEAKKVVHADLATRNVLMFHEDRVKISDFGLSRQLYGYTKYVKKSKSPLPFRWMALESLRFMEFTTQTDVWSYGVLVWEIFSLGQVPFLEFNWSDKFVMRLARGLRLPQPDYSTGEIYAEMVKCWNRDPAQRPSFEHLQNFFQTRLVKPKNQETSPSVRTARYVNAPS